MASTEFASWLKEELDRRGWTGRELARRAELSSGAISQVMTRANFPGPDFCNSVTRAFRLPPERIFREAGLLPPTIIGQEEGQECLEYFHYLTPERRRTVRALLKALYEEQLEEK